MTTPLTPIQIDAINRMSAEQRYDYFIHKIIELKEVWGLSSEAGWVILPDGDEENFPVWPHVELAAQWAAGEFADCQPKSISLEDWLNKWLPGMSEDGLLAAVCPDKEGDAIVVAPEEIQEELLEELQAHTGE